MCAEFLKKYSGNERIIDCVDPHKKSPLHIAAREGFVDICELLINRYQFNVNARDRGLLTPLHVACRFGHGTIVDLLVKSGAKLSSRDNRGRSVMHYAATSVND